MATKQTIDSDPCAPHPLGDTSEKGLRQSAGMMVNYRYKLNETESNHEACTGDGRVIARPPVKKQGSG